MRTIIGIVLCIGYFTNPPEPKVQEFFYVVILKKDAFNAPQDYIPTPMHGFSHPIDRIPINALNYMTFFVLIQGLNIAAF